MKCAHVSLAQYHFCSFLHSEALLLDAFITDSHGLLDYRLSNTHHTPIVQLLKNL
jgi:hypothetical protein